MSVQKKLHWNQKEKSVQKMSTRYLREEVGKTGYVLYYGINKESRLWRLSTFSRKLTLNFLPKLKSPVLRVPKDF